MKIAFDGQLFLKGNKTGIAWCAHNLILELAKYPENECVIQCFSKGYTEQQVRERLQEYVDVGCKIEYCKWCKYEIYKLIWNFIPVPYGVFFSGEPQITQFFNFVVPPGVKGKGVTIVHDMAYKACPETVKRKTRDWLRLSMKHTCRYAEHIITVSTFSKNEIVRYLHVEPQKITIIPNAVNHDEYNVNYTKKQIENIRKKYSITKEYFLYLGTIEPRKNLGRLIMAYAKLYKIKKDVPQLVLAGGKGWYYDRIFELVNQYKLKNHVLFTGYVAQEDSPILMAGAITFVFPSLYEGFGMPPLEAMACGTPVITSKTTSLPEVVGNAGILVDPESTDEICDAMKKMLDEPDYRRELSLKGEKRAEQFTWEKSAKMLMEVYRKL